MPISLRRSLVAVLLVIALAPLPRVLRAQVPSHFGLLTVPPANVGTCIDSVPTVGSRPPGLHGRQIAMASTVPGAARRDITIVSDSVGRSVRYAEMVSTFNGVNAGTGDAVVATRAPDGRWRGVRFHSATKMVGEGRGPDGRLKLPPEVKVERVPPKPLSATELVRVRELAEWAARRCPRKT